jgi:hypothetical protein
VFGYNINLHCICNGNIAHCGLHVQRVTEGLCQVESMSIDSSQIS